MVGIAFAKLENAEEQSIFERLYNEHHQRLFRIALYRLHNEQDAEDAVSECFLRILDKSANIFKIPPNKYTSFLNILIRNICLKMFDESTKKNTVSSENGNYPEIIDRLSLEDEVIGKIAKEDLVDFISQLPEKTRDALVLTAIMDFSYSEAAQQLGITENALRQRIFSARKAIKRFVEGRDMENV